MTLPWWITTPLVTSWLAVGLMILGPRTEVLVLPVLAGGIIAAAIGGAKYYSREGARIVVVICMLIALAFLALTAQTTFRI
ncbi:hypothetical protein [Deinococcus malanensis]|nr:hypothetical protein [Deinococcus malanensis]